MWVTTARTAATTFDPMMQRLSAWAIAHPRVADALVALFFVSILIAVGYSLRGTESEIEAPWQWVVLILPAVALLWRRSAPIAAIAMGTFATIVAWFLDVPNFALEASVLCYSAVVYGPPAVGRRWAFASTAALTSFAAFGVASGEADPYVIPVVAATLAVAIFLGMNVLTASTELEHSLQRAADLERMQAHEARHAIADERARIARELHDVVAHGLSVIVVQSGAAQRILETDTDGTRHALSQIESAARQSLTEMRQVLGVLRTEEADARRPASGADDISDLVTSCRENGLDVELWVSGDVRPLPATVDTGAYRIAQEALTNVLKHGGPKATATVNLHYGDEFLHLTVVDDGRGAAAENGSGHGLLGMRERVEVLDGTIRVGPVIGGGFEVDVTIPVVTAAQSTPSTPSQTS